MTAKVLWTDEQKSQLRSLWAEGLTFTQIGRRMGITKGSVSGQRRRMALEDRPKRPKVDLSGQQFSAWTVVSPVKKRFYYLCKCQCGNHSIIEGRRLVAGDTKRCQSCRIKSMAESAHRRNEERRLASGDVIKPPKRKSRAVHGPAKDPKAPDNKSAPPNLSKNPIIWNDKMSRPRCVIKAPVTKADEALIAKYIAERGVTKCPTVALNPTTATIPQEDMAAVIIHQQRQYDAWIARYMPRQVKATAASAKSAAHRRRVEA